MKKSMKTKSLLYSLLITFYLFFNLTPISGTSKPACNSGGILIQQSFQGIYDNLGEMNFTQFSRQQNFVECSSVQLKKRSQKDILGLSIPLGNNPVKKIKLGVDVLLASRIDLVKGKRVGLITNATGLTSDFESTIDVLYRQPEIKLVALFGPEHGIRGDIPAGESVAHYQDERTGLPVYSLYGNQRRPTKEMLTGIDVLIYDIQDIGNRAYTYIYTMAYAMQAAHEQEITFIVLDRPNPLSGIRVEGNILEPAFSSFIGLFPIPQVYGMTVGELACFFNHEFNINCDLKIVPMTGWRREMYFEDTGLFWTPTSPHVPRAQTALFVATTGCLGELDTISEGVGYPLPFEVVGAPWIDGQQLANELNQRHLNGVFFRPLHFRPYYYRFANEQCGGVQIHITNHLLFSPTATQIHILAAIQKIFPAHNIFNTTRIQMFDKAFGTDKIRKAIASGSSAEKIILSWQNELQQFLAKRAKYLIYK